MAKAYGGLQAPGRWQAKNDLDLPVSSGVGVTTMFSVLLILCITVFAVLAYASAQADLRLSRKNADMTTYYYEADGVAARISAIAADAWPQGAPKPGAARLADLEKALLDWGDQVAYASADGTGDGVTVAYGVKAGALMTLKVELFLPEGGTCEARSWRMEAEEPDIGNQNLPVWQGN